MSAEILTTIPTSGEFSERSFGEHFNSRLWVKFKDNNFEEWIGCFSKSYEPALCQAIVNEDNTRGFIVAGGQGYLVNLDTKELIIKLDEYPVIESAIITKNPNYFIAGTFYSIYVLNENELIKEICPDYIVDGIYFKSQIENNAIGEIATAENQYEVNVPFELDLATFKLTIQLKSKPGFIRRLWNKFIK